MEIFSASHQWATRPADQRFPSLAAMYDACKQYADNAREKEIHWTDLRVEAQGEDMRLIGRAGVPALVSHWAFGQLAARAEAPAGYLRSVPPTLAAQCINHGMASREDRDSKASLLFHSNGDLILRALTSDRYTRIWNYEVVSRLRQLPDEWQPAMPTIRKTANDQPALYASDHDMFAFLCTDRTISEPGNPDGLRRGVIVENSEVGARALKLTRFLFRDICGNFIIWGASQVVNASIRHVGSARDRWRNWSVEIKRYADESPSDQEAVISKAKRTVIAASKDELLDAVFGKRSLGLSRQLIAAGYEAAVPDQDGDPRTVWGLVQGITRHSQTVAFADDRNAIDRAAGKLLTVEF